MSSRPIDALDAAIRALRVHQDACLPPVVVDSASTNPAAIVMAIADRDGRTPSDGALAVRSGGTWLTKQPAREFHGSTLAQIDTEGLQASNWAVLHTSQGRASACKPITLGILARLADAGYEISSMVAAGSYAIDQWLWTQQRCGQEETHPQFNPVEMAISVLAARLTKSPRFGVADGIVVEPYSDDDTQCVGWVLSLASHQKPIQHER